MTHTTSGDRHLITPGLDRLAHGDGPNLQHKNISLLCHSPSLTADFISAKEVLTQRAKARVVSLLGPEHGIHGVAQDMEGVEHVNADRDAPPTYSLYGTTSESLQPTTSMFHDAEMLICDLQDIGSRYYTYVWTAVMASEAALKAGLEVMILDRPNPLGGHETDVEGGGIEAGYESFVGYHNVAVRHGLSIGELVRMTLEERGIVNLDQFSIHPCLGWKRQAVAANVGPCWVLPSPNMPRFSTALVYPGQCLWEGTNFSEGRGTTCPFEIFGAPWLDGQALRDAVDPEDVPGLTLRPLLFKPMFHKFSQQICGGVQLHIHHSQQLRSLRTSWALLRACWSLSKGHMEWRQQAYEFVQDRLAIDLLAGGPWLRQAVEAQVSVKDMLASQATQREAFLLRRRPFLLYHA